MLLPGERLTDAALVVPSTSAVMKQPMSPWIVFPSLTLFSQLRFPIMFYPRVLSMCADALVSLARLQKFLSLGALTTLSYMATSSIAT